MVTLVLDFFQRFPYNIGAAIVNGHISANIPNPNPKPHQMPTRRQNTIHQAKTTESK